MTQYNAIIMEGGKHLVSLHRCKMHLIWPMNERPLMRCPGEKPLAVHAIPVIRYQDVQNYLTIHLKRPPSHAHTPHFHKSSQTGGLQTHSSALYINNSSLSSYGKCPSKQEGLWPCYNVSSAVAYLSSGDYCAEIKCIPPEVIKIDDSDVGCRRGLPNDPRRGILLQLLKK